MIKCPKCGFTQPEDIYCASCGIKMDSYAKNNKASGLATNWMVHVCILVIVIISFVLYDKIANRKTRVAISTQSAPARNNRNTEARGNTNETIAPSAASNSSNKSAEISAPSETAQNAPPTEANSDSTEISSSPAQEMRSEKRNFNAGIQVSFYRISRQGISDLQKISQAINIAGESSGGVLAQTRVQQLITNGEMQYISANRYKDFDEKHPTVVFKGQRHPEASRNMGLFFQITSLRKTESSQLLEIRGWGALKVNEPDENYFTGEMTLSPKTAAYITGFLPKKSTYSEDEKQLFESDRVLKTINQEDFADGASDLIMFIEFSKSN